jgi:hypothetical protein
MHTYTCIQKLIHIYIHTHTHTHTHTQYLPYIRAHAVPQVQRIVQQKRNSDVHVWGNESCSDHKYGRSLEIPSALVAEKKSAGAREGEDAAWCTYLCVHLCVYVYEHTCIYTHTYMLVRGGYLVYVFVLCMYTYTVLHREHHTAYLCIYKYEACWNVCTSIRTQIYIYIYINFGSVLLYMQI